MRKNIPQIVFWLLLLLLFVVATAQAQRVIRGRVTESGSGKAMPGVSIVGKKSGLGTQTDITGAYRLSVSPGTYLLTYSAVGFHPKSRLIDVTATDAEVNLSLSENIQQLDDVLITGQTPDQNVTATAMSQLRLDIKNLKKIPVVFGEADILKALILQPGVTTVGEGAGGFNVRGGRTDQNLVLLDGAPIFNTSHLLGFLSNLNADAIQDAVLFKGNLPAAYGGRLSSLLLMNTKTGNPDSLRVTVGLGLLTSRVLAEGPLTRNHRLTFVVGGRAAYPNFVLRAFPSPTNQNRAAFYDVNARLTYQLAENSRVTSTVYHSVDQFKFPDDTAYGWQSTLGTVRWSQAISRRVSFNLTVLQSEYRFHLDGLARTNEFVYQSTIRQREARLDWLWTPTTTVRVEWGGSLLGYRLSPGTIGPSADSSNIRAQALPSEQAREGAGYLAAEWTVRPWLSVQAGLRYAGFQNVGPGKTYRYVEGVPRSEETITDTLSYGTGQALAKYGGWEPRVSLRIGAGPTGSIKLSYARTRQFLHLISNTTAISPVDFYKVSDALVPPQVADQWAVGYFRNFKNNTYELALEAYTKYLHNLVEYKNAATLLLNPYLDADLLRAKGQAYGIEASLQKTRGTLTGLIAYTYARTLVRVETPYVGEQVNRGGVVRGPDRPTAQPDGIDAVEMEPGLDVGYQFYLHEWSPGYLPRRHLRIGGQLGTQLLAPQRRPPARVPSPRCVVYQRYPQAGQSNAVQHGRGGVLQRVRPAKSLLDLRATVLCQHAGVPVVGVRQHHSLGELDVHVLGRYLRLVNFLNANEFRRKTAKLLLTKSNE
ncbi:MAG: TonB-dependent receptor [Cytophagaceae bacterium]|nr:TonB-dependent receptor [Cytophagaceae bacterium]